MASITHTQHPAGKTLPRVMWKAGGKPGSQNHGKLIPEGTPAPRTEETGNAHVKMPGNSLKNGKKQGNKGNSKGGQRGNKRA